MMPMDTIRRSFLLDQLAPFAAVYAQRPGGSNRGGGGFFHYFALWSMIKFLQPVHVIESGCFKGIGSWFLRQAAGDGVNMTFISPQRPTLYVDRHVGTRHFFGEQFRDFSDFPWELMLSPEIRGKTLIFFDDHQSGLRRSLEAARFGFSHVVFDDNYIPGAGDNFALKSFNSPRSQTIMKWSDNFDRPTSKSWYSNRQPLNASDMVHLRRIYEATVTLYYEFPPVWDGPNRFHFSSLNWGRNTKKPLLEATAASTLAAKYHLSMDSEASRYTHIAYAMLKRGARS